MKIGIVLLLFSILFYHSTITHAEIETPSGKLLANSDGYYVMCGYPHGDFILEWHADRYNPFTGFEIYDCLNRMRNSSFEQVNKK